MAQLTGQECARTGGTKEELRGAGDQQAPLAGT